MILWISNHNIILSKNLNLYPIVFVSVLFGIPLFIITGQYQALSRYVGSAAFYKIASRNFLLIIFLFCTSYFYDRKVLPISYWFLLWFFLSSFTGLTRFIS